MSRRVLWFVVPAGIDDPARVSGGNIYDRQLRSGLGSRGWTLRMVPVADATEAATSLDLIERDGIVLIDGLVAAWVPQVVESIARLTPVVVVAHMISAAFPGALAEVVDAESRALRSASRVVATSAWTASELVRMGLVARDRVDVAVPGSREVTASIGGDPGALLCVGTLASHKGQDVLLEALAMLGDGSWTCTFVGSPLTDPVFAGRIAEAAGSLPGRIRMPGVLHGADLDRAYRRAGLLVAPSRAESFGMAIADARSRGLPVVASAVGGIPEVVSGGGALLVPPGDARALADALAAWLDDGALRSRLRDEAGRERMTVARWTDTVDRVDRVLESV